MYIIMNIGTRCGETETSSVMWAEVEEVTPKNLEALFEPDKNYCKVTHDKSAYLTMDYGDYIESIDNLFVFDTKEEMLQNLERRTKIN